MKPLVSVLCPALNEEQHLRESLASLTAQTYANREILVLYDEASTDQTKAIIQSFEPRVRLVSLPHLPISKALNEGLKRAKGDLIFYAEGDCLYDPKTIELAVQPFENPQVGGVAILGTYYGVKGAWGKAQNEFQAVRDEWFLQGKHPVNWCYFYRRKVLDQLKGFNEELLQGEDQFLARAIKSAGYEIFCLPQKLRQHAISDSVNSPLKTARSSHRTAYLHALQSFSPQKVDKRLAFLGLSLFAAWVSAFHSTFLPLALVFAAAYAYNFARLLPFAAQSKISTATLFLAPFISLYKAFFYALGYLRGVCARPFVPVSSESRELGTQAAKASLTPAASGAPKGAPPGAAPLTVLMFGKSKRGGFYYYTTLLEEALHGIGVHTTNDWRQLLQADLVHYQFDDLFPLHRMRLLTFLFLARLAGKPVVVTAHNPVARGSRNPLKNLFYWVADQLIVHNPTVWPYAPKSRVIPHGNYCFYRERASPLTAPELKRKWGISQNPDGAFGPVLLSYGTLRASKNYPLTLAVVAELRRQGIPATLLLAGNGTPEQARAYGLTRLPDYVRFHRQYLTETETNELFTIADAVLLTNSEHDHSGIPHIAHCFRKPVIAPACLAHQTRFTASTKEEFVSLLVQVLKNPPDLRAEYECEVNDYSWGKIAQQTKALYLALLKKK